jgi:hypothetical protein
MTTFQEGDEVVKTMDENTMPTSSDEDISLENNDEDERTTFPKEGGLNDEDVTTTYDEDITLENDEEAVKTTFPEVRAPEVKKQLLRVSMVLPGLGEALGEKKSIQHYSLWKRIGIHVNQLIFCCLTKIFNFFNSFSKEPVR